MIDFLKGIFGISANSQQIQSLQSGAIARQQLGSQGTKSKFSVYTTPGSETFFPYSQGSIYYDPERLLPLHQRKRVSLLKLQRRAAEVSSLITEKQDDLIKLNARIKEISIQEELKDLLK